MGVESALAGVREPEFEISRAENTYRAVAMFASCPRDFVVLDLDPLEEDEFEFINVLRELWTPVFLVGMYSHPHRDKCAKAVEAGLDAFLLRPLCQREMALLMQRWAQRLRSCALDEPDWQIRLASLSRLAGGITREIEAPLMTLSGWLEIMRQDPERYEPETLLRSIKKEVQAIAGLVSRLASRNGNAGNQRQKVTVDRLLHSVLDEVRKTDGALQVEERLEAESAEVLGDENLLWAACQILMTKLVAHGAEGITVRSAVNGADCVNIDFQIQKPRHLTEEKGWLPAAPGGDDEQVRVSNAWPAVYEIVTVHGGELVPECGERSGLVLCLRLPLAGAASAARPFPASAGISTKILSD